MSEVVDYKKLYEQRIKEEESLNEKLKKFSQGFTLEIFPGYVVERHVTSKTIGELAPLSPLQQGIVRKVLSNGIVEFLLASTIVKLEPFYMLKEDETLAIRRRPEIPVLQLSDSTEIRKFYFIVFKRMLANRDCSLGWKRDNRKIEGLYSFNNEIIVSGHVVEVYHDGVVISANLTNTEDFTSWIFIGIADLKDISVFSHPNYCTINQIDSHIEKTKEEIKEILEFDAGMLAQVDINQPPKRIEFLYWRTDNILDRKVSFDGPLNATTPVSSLIKVKDNNRAVYDSLPPNKSHLKFSQGTLIHLNTKYKIHRFDNEGVVLKVVHSDSQTPNQSHHTWVPYSMLEKQPIG